MFSLILDDNLKETTVHGNHDFPFGIYIGSASMFQNGFLDWHWHDDFEINLVVSGTLIYFVENTRYFLQEGEAVVINAGRLHHAYTEDQSQNSHTIVFSSELLCADTSSEWYHSVIWSFIHSGIGSLHLTPNVPWMRTVLAKLEAIYQEHQQRCFGYELSIKGYLCRIFTEIIQNTPYSHELTAFESEREKRMQTLLSYISKHYMDDLTLSELAAQIGVSPSECSRFFSHQMQESLFSFLNRYRIERSCELLVRTSLPISEIAMKTGFNHFSYYSKCFRTFMHCTPSVYRKKIRNALQ